MPLSPGAWLNHYEILAHLGTGGNQSRAREQAAHPALHLSRDRKGADTEC